MVLFGYAENDLADSDKDHNITRMCRGTRKRKRRIVRIMRLSLLAQVQSDRYNKPVHGTRESESSARQPVRIAQQVELLEVKTIQHARTAHHVRKAQHARTAHNYDR